MFKINLWKRICPTQILFNNKRNNKGFKNKRNIPNEDTFYSILPTQRNFFSSKINGKFISPSLVKRFSLGMAVGTGLLYFTQNFVTAEERESESQSKGSKESLFYKLEAKDIDGNLIRFDKYQNKVVLVVNVASEWGTTKVNYTELQQLYSTYHDQGLEILAFPCNQFGKQEPGTNEQIKKFAEEKFDVTFTLFEKVEVNGPNAHPVFKYLCDALPGILGTKDIKWNFTKFLIDRNGIPYKRYATQTPPSSMKDHIQNLLAAKKT